MTTQRGSDATSNGRAEALTAIVRVDPAVQRKAALFVAGNAHNVEDCAQLLDMLGLNGRPVRSTAAHRQKQHNAAKVRRKTKAKG